jgi:uncharacterized protein (DUF2141 family)
MKLRLALPIVAAAIAVASAQQAPATPPVTTGLILGQAVDGVGGKPLAGVTVTLTGGAMSSGVQPAGAANSATRVLTGSDGNFVFHDLPKGSFTIRASKPGYADGAYGRRTPPGGLGQILATQTLDLTEGERKGGVAIALWKYAAIAGTVVDEAGEPLIGVQVRVLRRAIVAGRRQLTQTGNMPSTDDRGMYRIASLLPGDYVAAFVTTQATVPVPLQDAYVQALGSGSSSEFSRTIDSGASIPPTAGVRVGALVLLSGADGPGQGGSNDAPRIAPFRDGGTLFVYPTVFYPRAATATQAGVITLGAGEERANVDFQLTPVSSSRVSGTVTGPDGASAHTALQLLPAGIEEISRENSYETATAVTDTTGAFTFLGVTPGQYTIRVLRVPPRPVSADPGFTSVIQTGSGSTIFSGGGLSGPRPIPNEPTLWATLPVSVAESDVTGLAVSLRTGARVGGHVEFNGAAAKPEPDRLRQISISIESSDGRSTGSQSAFTIRQAQIDADGRLNSYQLPAGRYIVRATGSVPGWTFARAMWNGQDVSDTPFDLGGNDVTDVVLTFTDHPSELAGTVRDDRGSNDPAALVLVFPPDSRAWTDYGTAPRRMKSVRVSKDGVYKFTGLPDGDYCVAAIHEDVTADWQDPKFLQRLAAVAVRVTIAEGEKKSQDLKTSQVR